MRTLLQHGLQGTARPLRTAHRGRHDPSPHGRAGEQRHHEKARHRRAGDANPSRRRQVGGSGGQDHAGRDLARLSTGERLSTFAYTALDAAGKKKTGYIDANSKDAAVAQIGAEGRFVTEIDEVRAGAPRKSESGGEAKRKGKVSRSDLALFTRRLADLSGAGLPLDRTLQVVAEQSESQTLTDVAEAALDKVRSGIPVSDALADNPKLFPAVFTQTLRAGEASGQFPEVAGRLAEFQEKEVARRSQVVSALIYPSILALTAVGVVVFLLTFVVPKLSGIFQDLGDDLPITTKILLLMTGFLTNNSLILIGSIVVGYVVYRAWSATESGAYTRDKLMMSLPALGPVVRKATVSRFARVLGTLVYGGVPILGALE
ncbi:hypothetical protein EON79_12235, partial [bacterium]